MVAMNTGRYSANPAENALIEALMASYDGRPPRSLCVERDWDEDDNQVGARPYTRITLEPMIDAFRWFEDDCPKDLRPYITHHAWRPC